MSSNVSADASPVVERDNGDFEGNFDTSFGFGLGRPSEKCALVVACKL